MIVLNPEVDWVNEQSQDEVLKTLIEAIGNGKSLSTIQSDSEAMIHYVNLASKLMVLNNVLMKKNQDKQQILVPNHMVQIVLQKQHDNMLAGHNGQQKTLENIREHFYWYHMEKDCYEHCESCDTCQRFKKPIQANKLPLKSIRPSRAWDIVAIDFTGPFRRSGSGNQYIVVAIDLFTKYCEALATPDCTAQTTAKFIHRDIILRHEAPSSLLSDRGANFEAKVVQQLCDVYGVKKIRTTAYNPQCNGEVERQNKTIKALIARYINDTHTNWDDILPVSVSSYNNTIHNSIRISPYEALYGRKQHSIVKRELAVPEKTYDSIDKFVNDIRNKRNELQEKIKHGSSHKPKKSKKLQ
jgi:transposase InsO family protein